MLTLKSASPAPRTTTPVTAIAAVVRGVWSLARKCEVRNRKTGPGAMASPVWMAEQCQRCWRYRLIPSISITIETDSRTIPAFAELNTRLRTRRNQQGAEEDRVGVQH